MKRRGSLYAVAILLLLAGVAFTVWGVRALALGKARARAEARDRAVRALSVAAAHVARRWGEAPPTPPEAAWIVDARPDGRPPPDEEGGAALLLAEAEHLEHVRGDPHGAARLLERVAREDAGHPWGFVAALRAGAILRATGDLTDAEVLLGRASGAPPDLLDPSGVLVALAARYQRAALAIARGASEEALRLAITLGDGTRLSTPGHVGADDLLVALAAQARATLRSTPLAARLDALAARVHRGQDLLRRLPRDGAVLGEDATWAYRSGDRIEVRPLSALLDSLALPSEGAFSFRAEPVALRPDEVARRLTGALASMDLVVPVAEPPSAAGGLVGLLAGLLVYALGAVLAVLSLHRSQQAAQKEADFVAAVSHDLKTPIAGVRAMAEFLSTEPEPDASRVHEYARRIETEMGRLGAAVRNVLDVARIERQGRYPVSLEAGDPGEVAQAVSASLGPGLESRGFAFHARIEPAPCPVPLDAAALASALGNLLDNAAKYSTDRREIEFVARPRDGVYRIEVLDRGCGIEPRDLPRLFRRFERGERARRDAVPGVGLGLFVVRQIVTAHRGEVEARAREGGGSVFRVTLPLADEGGSASPYSP